MTAILRPPFTLETALAKVQAAEDAWNTRDPERVALAYTEDSEWRNRTEFLKGRDEIRAFLRRKWAKENGYRLKKELWGFRENRMAVRFEYEWHDESGQWYRAYGNEMWEFNPEGLMARRFASINDAPIRADERRIFARPMTLRVEGLWRYPVKTLAGESLNAARLEVEGIPSDRIVHVRGPEGVRTSRRHHRLLGLHGTLGEDGVPRIDGHPWDSAEALALVRNAAGEDAWLEAWDGVERFDVLPLLVATDGAVAEFGRDIRRLRPNILIGGVEGMDEVNWPGGELHIGEAVVGIDSRRGRCPMTTVDPDTLALDPNVLRDIGRRFGGRLALNAEVFRPGLVRVGDEVKLVRPIDRDYV